VFGVRDCVANDTFKEDFENTAGLHVSIEDVGGYLFVDEARDTLDTATAGETTDSGFGDAL
jgi:hypothetical protein